MGYTSSESDSFKSQQIEFPVSYVLKVILDTSSCSEAPESDIAEILKGLDLRFGKFTSKASNKNNFVSYSIPVTLQFAEQMQLMYERLKSLPGIKLAI
ncbi:MAG: DUF493 domain-containing protein [Bacteroidales bacterium]|nr:DUF493 domain-containing protein [Bacteroidales bacterium]